MRSLLPSLDINIKQDKPEAPSKTSTLISALYLSSLIPSSSATRQPSPRLPLMQKRNGYWADDCHLQLVKLVSEDSLWCAFSIMLDIISRIHTISNQTPYMPSFPLAIRKPPLHNHLPNFIPSQNSINADVLLSPIIQRPWNIHINQN